MIFRHKKDGGWLELNWANRLGCSRTCNVCLQIFVLPTKSQLMARPHLVKEMKDITIEGMTKFETCVLKS